MPSADSHIAVVGGAWNLCATTCTFVPAIADGATTNAASPLASAPVMPFDLQVRIHPPCECGFGTTNQAPVLPLWAIKPQTRQPMALFSGGTLTARILDYLHWVCLLWPSC